MASRRGKALCLTLAAALLAPAVAFSWTPLPVADDPLFRMPGTQPDQGANLQEPALCINCHGERQTDALGNVVSPGFSWSGSMMAQAARDPIFWACMAVAAQDSVWVLGNPNAVDLCERYHFPEGWLAGRSDPPNASLMTGSDFDGVHCDLCHRMWDPFFDGAYAGTRESADWAGYWDEFGNTGPGSGTPSQDGADATLAQDQALVPGIKLFSGGLFDEDFFVGFAPRYATYVENGGGQFFVDTNNIFGRKRASFADGDPDHTVLYSRYHKSRYFCSTCHDVSNPALANLGLSGLADQSGGADQITEQYSAANYFHVERTFSEFALSAYGRGTGAATRAPFQAQGGPAHAAACQDCHVPGITGKGCAEVAAPLRPDESAEHPNSGAPLHDLQGGNAWISYILGTLDDHFPATYDEVNFDLFNQGPAALTLNISAGISPVDNGEALLAASQRALQQLRMAATITNVSYNPVTGALAFRVQNNTGHKLISGFPEGRRMFVNIKAYSGGSLVYEVNPYDEAAGTLKGPEFPASPVLGANESYEDPLVYESHPNSTLTGEAEKTFHFVLATGRYKDNRIPPQGFDIANAATRLSQAVYHGVSDTGAAPGDYYTPAEYTGGYDDVSVSIPPGADRVTVALYYQGTSREYVEFLRDEINGDGTTLTSPTPSGEAQAYIAQTDPFFGGLKAWGDTIWGLWYHNHGLDGSGAAVPGIVPFGMTHGVWGGDGVGTVAGNRWHLDVDGTRTFVPADGDAEYIFGKAGDQAVVGDWDGNGVTEVGVFRDGRFFLDVNGDGTFTAGGADRSFRFGEAGDVAVAGDWDGDGATEVGVVRGNRWYLDVSGDGSFNPGDGDLTFRFGKVGDIPVAGDWDGDGTAEAGAVRGNRWYLDVSGDGSFNPGDGDLTFVFGLATDLPVTGDWAGTGESRVGVYRSGRWYLDVNGDGAFSVAAGDVTFRFGDPAGMPVAGLW